eukprot:1159372-Pyramimonas_sp.AAC.1
MGSYHFDSSKGILRFSGLWPSCVAAFCLASHVSFCAAHTSSARGSRPMSSMSRSTARNPAATSSGSRPPSRSAMPTFITQTSGE